MHEIQVRVLKWFYFYKVFLMPSARSEFSHFKSENKILYLCDSSSSPSTQPLVSQVQYSRLSILKLSAKTNFYLLRFIELARDFNS